MKTERTPEPGVAGAGGLGSRSRMELRLLDSHQPNLYIELAKGLSNSYLN